MGEDSPSAEYRKWVKETQTGVRAKICSRVPPPPGNLLPLGKSHFSKLPELPKDHDQGATQQSQGVPVGGIALLLFCCCAKILAKAT